MKVSLSPVNYYKNPSFQAKNDSKKETSSVPTRRAIEDARIKKSVSECFWVILGVAALYMFSKVKCKQFLTNRANRKNSELIEFSKRIMEPILPTAKDIPKK